MSRKEIRKLYLKHYHLKYAPICTPSSLSSMSAPNNSSCSNACRAGIVLATAILTPLLLFCLYRLLNGRKMSRTKAKESSHSRNAHPLPNSSRLGVTGEIRVLDSNWNTGHTHRDTLVDRNFVSFPLHSFHSVSTTRHSSQLPYITPLPSITSPTSHLCSSLNLTFPPLSTLPYPIRNPLSLARFPQYFEALVSVLPPIDSFRIGIGVTSSLAVHDTWDAEGRVAIKYHKWWVDDLFSFSSCFEKSSSTLPGTVAFAAGYTSMGELSLYGPSHLPSHSEKMKESLEPFNQSNIDSVEYLTSNKKMPKFTCGDVIGIGWERDNRNSSNNNESADSIYFTKNGVLLARCFIPPAHSFMEIATKSTSISSIESSNLSNGINSESFSPYFVTDAPCQLFIECDPDHFLYIPTHILYSDPPPVFAASSHSNPSCVLPIADLPSRQFLVPSSSQS